MRRVRSIFIIACVLLGTGQFVAGQPKYGVSVKTVKPAGLAKARTYVWAVTHPALDKTVDGQIVAAVDRALAAHGLTKVSSGRSDVVVTYASLGRTDVVLKSPSKGGPSNIDVGTLVVDLNDATSHGLLFRVRADTPFEREPAALEATINSVVTAMFDKYPSPSQR